MKTLSVLVVAGLITACGSGAVEPTPETRGEGGSTSVRAVEGLVELLNSGEFVAAVDFALEGQAALAALSEGASASEVADALSRGDLGIAANFWAGFAQGTGNFLFGPVGYQGSDPVTRDGREFAVVVVSPPAGGQRRIFLQKQDGYRVDLFASFGAGLAPRMIEPVERLLAQGTNDSRQVMRALRDVVPSLLVASEEPNLPAESVQAILQLVEVITRVG